MELLTLEQTTAGFHIKEFPHAIKVIRLKDTYKTHQLCSIALHRQDLDFVQKSLDELEGACDLAELTTMQNATWKWAISGFIKCFGAHNSRTSLDYKKIYKNKVSREVFRYFKELRDKHLLHDENYYNQAIPGAVLNKRDYPYKIEKIVTISCCAMTFNKELYNNMKLLAKEALEWVIARYDELCEDLTNEYEQLPYEELLDSENLVVESPLKYTVSKSRKNK